MSVGNSYFIVRCGHEGESIEPATREQVGALLDRLAGTSVKVCSSWDEWLKANVDDVLIIRGNVVPVRAVEVVKKWELP